METYKATCTVTRSYARWNYIADTYATETVSEVYTLEPYGAGDYELVNEDTGEIIGRVTRPAAGAVTAFAWAYNGDDIRIGEWSTYREAAQALRTRLDARHLVDEIGHTAGNGLTPLEFAQELWAQRATGATLTSDADTVPTTGYVVGGLAPALIDPVDAHEVAAWIGAYHQHAHAIGVWTDSDDMRTYFDQVEIGTEIDPAMSAGRERGEIAIWDLGTQSEIRL